ELEQHAAMPLTWSDYATLAKNKSYVLNALGMAMFTFALGGLQALAPTYLVQQKRVAASVNEEELAGLDNEARVAKSEEAMSERANNRLGVVAALGGLVGTMLGGWIADRLARRWTGAYFWFSGATVLAACPFIIAALTLQNELALFGCLLAGLTFVSMNY